MELGDLRKTRKRSRAPRPTSRAPIALAALAAAAGALRPSSAAPPLERYYGHAAVHDERGVIAPWRPGLDGPCDFRVRIAAETLKRFPWTAEGEAPARAPHYVYTGTWSIAADGTISPKRPSDWANGDIGQRATNALEGWVAYYRYAGDGAAFAHLSYMAELLLGSCTTPPDHPWPGMFVSVPVKGKPYGACDPRGMIQLDLCASAGLGLLRAGQMTGNVRWIEAAKRWGDLLARRADLEPGKDPWPRYANLEDVPWKSNKQTGGITMILAFLDALAAMGYSGEDGRIIAAREAGRRHLREVLLPAWHAHDTWGRYFWDWENQVQNCITTPDAARYMMDHRDAFPLWRTDARNLLTLFLNRSCVSPESSGGMYSGAWAYPEASNCCGRSLWYPALCMAPAFAEWAALTESSWARELTVRQLILAGYDVHETGVTEDAIDGGVIVNGDWLNIAHPLPLRFILETISWLPEDLAPSRENHIVRSTSVVRSAVYGSGRIEYATFDAPPGTQEVLRLAFVPSSVEAGGRKLPLRGDLSESGFTVRKLPNGDAIVAIRHDGEREVVVAGNDPHRTIEDGELACEGPWRREEDPEASAGSLRATETRGAAAAASFEGIAVRVLGPVGPDGGLADVEVDGALELVPIDAWSPIARSRQVLYSRSGLAPGRHTVRIAARGEGNPRSAGARVAVDAVVATPAGEAWNFRPAGAIEAQRLVFGRTAREDYVDSEGRSWRPGAEFVVRLGPMRDPVEEVWWTEPAPGPIEGTPDPELYRYGVHAPEFWVALTVGPGPHRLRLKFAAARGPATAGAFTVRVNGRAVVEDWDVSAAAGGPNRAADLVFDRIEPLHGAIEVRFEGSRRAGAEGDSRAEAFVQALEVAPDSGG